MLRSFLIGLLNSYVPRLLVLISLRSASNSFFVGAANGNCLRYSTYQSHGSRKPRQQLQSSLLRVLRSVFATVLSQKITDFLMIPAGEADLLALQVGPHPRVPRRDEGEHP